MDGFKPRGATNLDHLKYARLELNWGVVFGQKDLDKVVEEVTIGDLRLETASAVLEAGLDENEGVPDADVVLACRRREALANRPNCLFGSEAKKDKSMMHFVLDKFCDRKM